MWCKNKLSFDKKENNSELVSSWLNTAVVNTVIQQRFYIKILFCNASQPVLED